VRGIPPVLAKTHGMAGAGRLPDRCKQSLYIYAPLSSAELRDNDVQPNLEARRLGWIKRRTSSIVSMQRAVRTSSRSLLYNDRSATDDTSVVITYAEARLDFYAYSAGLSLAGLILNIGQESCEILTSV